MPNTWIRKLLIFIYFFATVTALIATYQDANDQKELTYFQKTQILLEIASQLNNALATSYEQILLERGAINLPEYLSQ